jgi:phosphoglycolate phosphatase
VPRILLFDIDGTLLKTAGAGRGAMTIAFEREFGVASVTEGILFDGRTDRGIFHECLERHGFGGEELLPNFTRFASRYLEHFPGSLAERGGVVLPGVVELLDALAGTDAIVGLATGNLRLGAEHKLRHFGLWDRFAGGGFGDDHTVRADLVTAGIAEMEATFGLAAGASEVVVLGDTPLDVEAAHLAGAKALGVGTGRFTPKQLTECGAEFAVEDLSDTARVMEMLLG